MSSRGLIDEMSVLLVKICRVDKTQVWRLSTKEALLARVSLKADKRETHQHGHIVLYA
jgi:hypothetical protein